MSFVTTSCSEVFFLFNGSPGNIFYCTMIQVFHFHSCHVHRAKYPIPLISMSSHSHKSGELFVSSFFLHKVQTPKEFLKYLRKDLPQKSLCSQSAVSELTRISILKLRVSSLRCTAQENECHHRYTGSM